MKIFCRLCLMFSTSVSKNVRIPINHKNAGPFRVEKALHSAVEPYEELLYQEFRCTGTFR